MKNGKQVMKKPQKKVDGHEEGWKEEGKDDQLAIAYRQRLPPGIRPARSAEGIYR